MDSSLLWPLALALAAAVLPFYLIADLRARRSRKELREQNILLDAALGNMAQGLNMFDSAGRLVLNNDRYIEMYALPRAAVKPGMTVRELVELRLAAGTFFKTDPERYADELVELDQEPDADPVDARACRRAHHRRGQSADGERRLGGHPQGRHRAPAARSASSRRPATSFTRVIENVPATIAGEGRQRCSATS